MIGHHCAFEYNHQYLLSLAAKALVPCVWKWTHPLTHIRCSRDGAHSSHKQHVIALSSSSESILLDCTLYSDVQNDWLTFKKHLLLLLAPDDTTIATSWTGTSFIHINMHTAPPTSLAMSTTNTFWVQSNLRGDIMITSYLSTSTYYKKSPWHIWLKYVSKQCTYVRT